MLLKKGLTFLFATLLVLILSFVAFITLIDPTEFRDRLQNEVLKQTGRTLIIKGPMRFRLAGGFALEAEDLILRNIAAASNEVLTAQKIRFAPSLFNLGITPSVKISIQDGHFSFETPSHQLVSGDVEGQFNVDIRSHDLKTLSMEGQLSSHKVQIDSLTLFNIKSSIFAKDAIVFLNPFELEVANGKHFGQVQIDLQNASPSISILEEGKDFEINDLLKLVHSNQKIMGKTHLKTKFSFTGLSYEEFMKTLTGQFEISLSNGIIHGISLETLLEHIEGTLSEVDDYVDTKELSIIGTILNRELGELSTHLSKDHRNSTPFESLQAKATFEKGVIKNKELALLHPKYTVFGKGTLDLNTQMIDYITDIKHLNSPNSTEKAYILSKIPLSLQITGPIHSPTIRPNLGSLTNALKELIPEKIVEKISIQSLKKLFQP